MFFHEVPHQCDVLLRREFQWKRDGQVSGKLGIGAFFKNLDLVPEGFDRARDRAVGNQCPYPFRGICRQRKLFVHQALFAGVVDGAGLALILHPGAMPVRRRQHGAAAVATADYAG